MSRAPRFFTQEQISKRIKSGRGQGMGKDYQPWLTIQDVPSRGVSHRIYSHKTQRVHHLLSMIYAELSGDFPLGDSRQPTYKSLRPFDLVS